MNTKILLKIGIMALCFVAISAEAQELFQKEYGFQNLNTRIRQQLPSTIIQAQDSGFASINVALEVPRQNNQYITGGMILKTDKHGEVQWSKYLRTVSDYDIVYPNSIIQATDGGFYICGRFIENASNQSLKFLLKMDKDGNKLWIKNYTVSPERSFIFRTLAEISDNSFFLLGSGLLLKIDSSGNCLWAKQFSHGYNVIKKDSDSTFILAGIGLAQIDTAGHILWAKNYDFPSALYVQPLKAGGYGLVSNRGGYVSKTDNAGNILWAKRYNFNLLNPAMIDELDSGKIIIAGTYGTPSEGQLGWITILNSLGNLQSVKFLQQECNIFSGVKTFDNCFVVEADVLNNTKSERAALLKIDRKGNRSCPEKEKVMYLTIEDYPIRDSILSITDTLIQITASDLPCEFLSVDINATDICAPTDILEEAETGDFQLFPNPASGMCTILLKEVFKNMDVAIIDINGRTLYRKFFKNAGSEIKLDISPLQPGVYFIKVAADGKEFMRKMMVE